VIDAGGRLLEQTTTANSSYSFNYKTTLCGVYFIRIDESDKTTVLKFISNNGGRCVKYYTDQSAASDANPVLM
jgi:hypothetical protein